MSKHSQHQETKAKLKKQSPPSDQQKFTEGPAKAGGPGGPKGKKFRPENPWKTTKQLFSYFRSNKLLFFTGIICVGLASLTSIALNAMLAPIIDSVTGDFDQAAFVRSLLILAGIGFAQAAFMYLGNRANAVLSQRSINLIRQDLSAKVLRLPMSFFDSRTHGEVMSTFTSDIDTLSQTLDQAVSQFMTSIITFLGTAVMMLILSWKLFIVVAVFLSLMVLVTRFIAQRSGRFYRERQLETARLNGYVEEMMTAQKVVKVFNYEDRAIQAFEERAEALRSSATKASSFGVVTWPVMRNLSFVMYAVVAMLGAMQVISEIMSIGNLVAFLQYIRVISRPITQISQQMNSLFAAIAGAERIFRLLAADEEEMEGPVRLVGSCDGKKDLCWWVPDSVKILEAEDKVALNESQALASTSPGKTTDQGYRLVPVAGDVRFHGVDFGYVPGQTVLHDISLYAKPGQKIAFVGSTGAGKTTITKLINRFYDIQEGYITIDGIDIREINKYDLRSIIAVVLQDVNLFSGTIRENIRYGRLEASDAEVIEAAQAANAHPFIARLEEGYDTELVREGDGLSQGERQLLSIARTAIADPIIVIMDEATSSVDTRTEMQIARGMDQLMAGRTTFVIAHRLSTVRDANAIMVLEGGQIVERGDHDELMAQQGRYYDLNVGTIELD
ncbi:MAG: ABC transporter ATP-binding protein [Eubacteriales bacterium]|nr:ABC transporter ATP-binding protein [Eubacteriales bacterium]